MEVESPIARTPETPPMLTGAAARYARAVGMLLIANQAFLLPLLSGRRACPTDARLPSGGQRQLRRCGRALAAGGGQLSRQPCCSIPGLQRGCRLDPVMVR